MLRRFSVSNYRSFKEEAVLDFTLTKRDKGQGWYRDFSSEKGKAYPVSTVAGIFGANGSGKSCLVKGLEFVLHFARRSSFLEKTQPIPVQSWFHNSDPSVFKIEYQNREKIFYEYTIAVTRSAVIRETLKESTNNKKDSWNVIYDRSGNDVTFKKGVFKKLNYNLLQSKVTILSLAEQQGANVDDIVNPLLILFHFNPVHMETIPTHILLRSVTSHLYHLRNDKPQFFKDLMPLISSFLTESDTGLVDIDIEDDKDTLDDDGPAIKLYGVHQLDDGTCKKLLFSLESEGTRILFCYLFNIMLSLMGGSVLVIDELDSALHFFILEKMVNLFNSQETNPKGAQLVFTTHSENLMNTIGKAHIYLTEKIDNKSEVWRLDTMANVRPNDNYRSKYLAGLYGGVPLV